MKLDKQLAVTFREERVLQAQGFTLIAGIDEAGRGPLAGPVVAGAVIMPRKFRAPWLKEIRDSKFLTAAKREELFQVIKNTAIASHAGVISPEIIDKEGIAKAARLAMKAAVDGLFTTPDYLLIDHFELPEVSLPQKGVVEGDSFCFSIACASIIAKVTRDRIMVDLDKTYPGYCLAENKGYGTREHYEGLDRLGPCPIHRMSFAPVRQAFELRNGT